MGVGVSLSGLASAVANEGGVGVISSAGLGLLYRNFSSDFLEASIYGLKEEIRLAREKTSHGSASGITASRDRPVAGTSRIL